MASNPTTSNGRNSRGTIRRPTNIQSQSNIFATPSTSVYNRQEDVGESSLTIADDVYKLLKCPTCSEIMELPIYMCKSGHNICHKCCLSSPLNLCPLCNNEMSTQRNLVLEQLSTKVGIQCPNKTYGCGFTATRKQISEHVEYCQFQNYVCPVKKFNGLCPWEGNISEIFDHFKERHSNNMILKPDIQVIFKNLDINKHDRDVQLFIHNNLLFLYSTKIDNLTKTANWSIQYIGCDKNASDWIYEIHLYNSEKKWKKITIVEECRPYSEDFNAGFISGDCASIPLNVVQKYLNAQGNLTFKFYIKEKPSKV